MRAFIFTSLFGLTFSVLSFSQKTSGQLIVGEVYKISRKIPYGDRSFFPEFEKDSFLTQLIVEEIDIIQRDFRAGFPGLSTKATWFAVDYKVRFGIKAKGWYRFKVQSDDGSILYIDDKELINNGGQHKPKSKEDSIFLEKGNHKLRLKYFQGFIPLLCLRLWIAPRDSSYKIFNIKDYPLLRIDKKETIMTLTISDALLFEVGEHQLTDSAVGRLEAFRSRLRDIKEPYRIDIIGHTDDQGTSDYNLGLSEKRAEAVRSFFMAQGLDGQSIRAKGMGEQQPLVPNDSPKNRQKNRRVEILVFRTK